MSDIEFLELALRAYINNKVQLFIAPEDYHNGKKGDIRLDLAITYIGKNLPEIISVMKTEYARLWLNHIINGNNNPTTQTT